MGRFVTILSHIITTQVKRSSSKHVLCQRYISKHVFSLCCPGNDLTFPDSLILTIVYLQAIKVFIAPEKFGIHHSTEIEVHARVGIGGNVTAVISQQKTKSGIEIFVTFLCTSGCLVGWLVYQMFGGFCYIVIVDVYLWSSKYVAVA